MCKLKVFVNFGMFSAINPSNIVFCSFLCLLSWDSHCEYVGTLDVFPQVSEALLIFFNRFSFSTSYCIIYFYLLSNLLILSSAISNLLLRQSSECSISIIIYFNSRISILFIILNSICLKKFSFCIGFLLQMVSAAQC